MNPHKARNETLHPIQFQTLAALSLCLCVCVVCVRACNIELIKELLMAGDSF